MRYVNINRHDTSIVWCGEIWYLSWNAPVMNQIEHVKALLLHLPLSQTRNAAANW